MRLQRLAVRLAKIVEMHLHVERLLQSFDASTAAAGHGVHYLDARILGAIHRLGPISLKRVAEAVRVPKTSLHYMLGRLEQAGHLRREDGRRKGTPVYSITAAGIECLESAALALVAAPFAQVLGEMPDAELDRLVDLGRKVRCLSGQPEENEAIGDEAILFAVFLEEARLRRRPATDIARPAGDRHTSAQS